MRTVKDPRGWHNRINHGSWKDDGDKEEKKQRRKLFKAIRHKLLFRIPLSPEEDSYRQAHSIEEDSPMTPEGYRAYKPLSGKAGKHRYTPSIGANRALHLAEKHRKKKARRLQSQQNEPQS